MSRIFEDRKIFETEEKRKRKRQREIYITYQHCLAS